MQHNSKTAFKTIKDNQLSPHTNLRSHFNTSGTSAQHQNYSYTSGWKGQAQKYSNPASKNSKQYQLGVWYTGSSVN